MDVARRVQIETNAIGRLIEDRSIEETPANPDGYAANQQGYSEKAQNQFGSR